MRLVLVTALCGPLMACGPKERTQTREGEEARRAVLASAVERVIVPTYVGFADRATALSLALDALVQAEAGSDAPASREAAQAAWVAAMDSWQEAELYLLGPAAPMAKAAGGKDLRDKLYSWPITNACRVDQETLRGVHVDAASLDSAPANVRGLDALEWLLFVPSRDNACPPQTAINAEGTWAALSDEELRVKRATHAAAIAKRLELDARALRDAWLESSGDFARELAEAGLTPTYRSAQEGLNALSDAMFYLEKEVKDMKLAIPLGLRDCSSAVCPDKTENPLSRRSLAHVLINAKTFLRLYHGGPDAATGTGFDDLLIAVGANELATTLEQRVATAITSLEELGASHSSLEEALAADRPKVLAAYEALRAATDILKTEFLSVLDLELPQRAEGDND